MVKYAPAVNPKEVKRIAFSISELAISLGCSERILWKLVHQGKISHVRIGRRVLITQNQINNYLQINSVS
jgi:excisionase family DNA binding protein